MSNLVKAAYFINFVAYTLFFYAAFQDISVIYWSIPSMVPGFFVGYYTGRTGKTSVRLVLVTSILGYLLPAAMLPQVAVYLTLAWACALTAMFVALCDEDVQRAIA